MGSTSGGLKTRRDLGLLGSNICGHPDFEFDIRIQLGAGAYICGEESSLIESLEGKRGSPRDRPPYPTEHGYLQQPSAVDNVETYVCAARILEKGSAWFAGYGTKASTGTKLLSVSGDCTRPGVYEMPFGVTFNELLDLAGAPEAAYVQIGGPSGQAIAPKDFGRCLEYEDLFTGGSVMIFGPGRDVLDIALQFTEFFASESCGWCAPCRVGTTLLKKSMEKIVGGRATLADVQATEALAGTVARMSRCGLGQSAPNPILTTMRNFPELYEARLAPEPFTPLVTLHDALREAVEVQGREPTHERPDMGGQTFQLTIDGTLIDAAEGQSVIEACDAAGIYIPRLCHHPDLKPSGNCRVCTCKINGRASAACVTPAAHGMVVENNTPQLTADRRALIEMLFVEGNHPCPYCVASGDCELQALGYRLGMVAPHQPYQWPGRKIDATHPDIYLDHDRCILCSRCIRASRMEDGKTVFAFEGRGIAMRLNVDAKAGSATPRWPPSTRRQASVRWPAL